MSAGRRLPLEQAQVLADELYHLLEPACERIALAGSIRRGRADVGDVEIVAIPRWQAGYQTDMFGLRIPTDPVSQLETTCDRLLENATLEYRPRPSDGAKVWGPKLKHALYRGFAVDLFATTDACWAVVMVLRTGPAEFSHRLVTQRRQGGLCPHGLSFRESRIWREGEREPVFTPDEQAVFRTLRLAYVPPERRFANTTPRELTGARQ